MSAFDIIIAILFAAIVFVAGISFLRKGGGTAVFFGAGGAVPWWISGLSLYMSFFSVGTFVVWGSIAYTSGLIAVTIQATMCVAGVAVALIFAPIWNRTSTLTVAEFIDLRLGRKVKVLFTLLFLFVSIFTTANFLYPVGKIIEVSTGAPLEASIITLGMLVLIYTAAGGLWAVMVTDVLQFIVLTAAVLIAVPLAFIEVGGVGSFLAQAPEGFFNPTNAEYGIAFLAAFAVYNAVYVGANWAYVQRYTSVRSPEEARKTGWLFAGLYTISPLIWMLPPMIYRIMQPDTALVNDEEAYLLISREIFPIGMFGMVVAGMVFATASSINTTLNISAAVFTKDIYQYFRRAISGREEMIVARLSTALFGVATIAVALLVQQFGGILEWVISVAALTGVPLFLPPFWAAISKRQTAFTVATTTLVSLAINLFMKLAAPLLWGISLNRTEQLLLGVLGPTTLLVLFEIRALIAGTSDPAYETYEKQRTERYRLHQQQTDLSDAKSDGVRAQNRGAIAVILWAVVAIAILMIGLGLIPSAASAALCGMGAVLFIIAAYGTRRIHRRNRGDKAHA